jgi:hypothetical protein
VSLASGIKGQTSPEPTPKGTSGIVLIGAGYQSQWINFNSLQKAFPGEGFSKELSGPSFHINQPSIRLEPGQAPEPMSDISQFFQYYIPQKSDSNATTLSGFNLGVNESKDLLYRLPNIDLLITFGANTGRLKTDGAGSKYTNPFFCFNGGIETRYNFNAKKTSKGWTIGARTWYQYDVSKSAWKQKNGDHRDLPGIRAHGLSVNAYLGYYIKVL